MFFFTCYGFVPYKQDSDVLDNSNRSAGCPPGMLLPHLIVAPVLPDSVRYKFGGLLRFPEGLDCTLVDALSQLTVHCYLTLIFIL